METNKEQRKAIEDIQLPDKVKMTVQELMRQEEALRGRIATYMKGFMDSRGLEDNWMLDTQKWVLTKKEPPKEK